MAIPKAPLSRLIRVKARPVAVYRRDDTTSSTYGSDITYSRLDEPRNILIVGFEESRQPTDAGERQGVRLTAYADSSVDFQVNDRIEHGSRRFEVVAREGRPDDHDPAINRFELENV